jgi:hypothetical protein
MQFIAGAAIEIAMTEFVDSGHSEKRVPCVKNRQPLKKQERHIRRWKGNPVCDKTLEKTIAALFNPADLVEVRALRHGKSPIIGLYDNHDQMAKDIHSDLGHEEEVTAVYYTLNPVSPEILKTKYPAYNSLAESGTAVGNQDITQRRWLFIDVDPRRESGTAATERQKKEADTVAEACKKLLVGYMDWPEPIVCDSGNGYHLLFRIDLPNNPESYALVSRCLKALATRYDTDTITIDQAVSNAARITRAYGTVNRKGEESKWHTSKALVIPNTLGVVPIEKLKALAAEVQVTAVKAGHKDGPPELVDGFDVNDFAVHFDLEFFNPDGEQRGTQTWYHLTSCPFKGDTHRGQAAGKTSLCVGDTLGFSCFSDECSGKKIGDLLSLLCAEHGQYTPGVFVTAGVRNARAAGKQLGRPSRIVDRDEILRLRATGASVRTIATKVGIGYGTVRKRLAQVS